MVSLGADARVRCGAWCAPADVRPAGRAGPHVLDRLGGGVLLVHVHGGSAQLFSRKEPRCEGDHQRGLLPRGVRARQLCHPGSPTIFELCCNMFYTMSPHPETISASSGGRQIPPYPEANSASFRGPCRPSLWLPGCSKRRIDH
eukprot:216501-Pyramimonas_sp.AAC.1